MNKLFLLFTVIVIEGYVVLATELLAIRQIVPYVGSGTDIVSIVIAAVLMPLAAGYYFGGQYRPGRTGGRFMTVRARLIRNILIAATFLLPGLSYITLEIFFITLLSEGVANRLVLTAVYSLAFLVVPVFLLGQTVPLVSNFFSREKLSRITGKMLFCSTTGSFLGAIVSTLVLMTFAGVNNTVNAVFLLLTLLVFLLVKNRRSEQVVYIVCVTIACLALNSGGFMRKLNIVENNAYNTSIVMQDEKGLHLIQNNSDSSLLGPGGRKHNYVEFVEKHFIEPTYRDGIPPKDILVVGAAGFTVGDQDRKNRYVFVDIDKDIKKIAEEHFLKRKLSPNKSFYGEDIRSYLTREHRQFDLILLDAFLGNITFPEQLATREFMMQIKGALKTNGIMVANFIASPMYEGAFSQNIDNTLRSVFPHVSRQVIDPGFNAWDTRDIALSNLIYFSRNDPAPQNRVYTDNMNRVSMDKPRDTPLSYSLERERDARKAKQRQDAR